MDEKEKIQILLEEYKTLRGEIMQRHTGITQIYTVSGIAFVTVIGLSIANHVIWGGLFLCSIVILLVFGATLVHDNDARMIASRLREIEAEVNRRAEDKLLEWETRHGLLAIGYAERFRSIWSRLGTYFSRSGGGL